MPNETNVIYREDMLDRLAVLPWLAGVTSRIALGTSVVILPCRSPIPVAKLQASVECSRAAGAVQMSVLQALGDGHAAPTAAHAARCIASHGVAACPVPAAVTASWPPLPT